MFLKYFQYRDEVSKISSNDSAVFQYLPGFNSIKSTLYKIRASVIPKLPKTISDIKIDGQWSKTENGENFLLCDDGIGQNRIIVSLFF